MTTQKTELPTFTKGAINLASPRIGADVIYATDEFFAPKNRLLNADSHNFFENTLKARFNYLRLNIYSDGGISRFRVLEKMTRNES
ncbi:MAG TPA: hypothetical protein QF359_10205 [Rhodospirillales bacterium]|jgi:allantoicase|nr:hypothetical protein [Rhodospirillales bacterium]MDP7623484.1 hypothetical protein [Rhodospirillales bacterium]HJO87324.1 hypothetical protein [Rhodospirillales bacterium]|tara:strand:+ start:8297 stop:8554 length:258 start_codon:yes stop_codon:yes gene_type:complete